MGFDKKSKNKSGLKRILIEWGGLAVIVAVLYFTGLHTEVLGAVQRAVLWTGLFNAKTHTVATTNGPMLTKRAYDMPLIKPGGKKVKLGDYKGKVLFVNIWASWCPPCVAEMPTIKTLYNNVKDNEHIKFVMISLDEKKKDAVDFMKGKDFPMPYYFPVSGIPDVFQSSYIPTTYVVSKEGEIIYKHGGMANYSKKHFREWLIKQAK